MSLTMEPGATVSTDDPQDSPEEGLDALVASAVLARYVRSAADRRNFLFLVLKCSRLIDTRNAPALAQVAGVTTQALMALIETLCEMRGARESRHAMFRDRRNRSFAAIRLLETELRDETDPAKRVSTEQALAKMRRRMASAMQRMSRVGCAPTNLEISRVLGVPKGTVDSGLYWLKRKLAPVYDPDNLRSA